MATSPAGVSAVKDAIYALWEAHSKTGDRAYLDALTVMYTAKEEYPFMDYENWVSKFYWHIRFATDILHITNKGA
jgi:hypothetical protein